ncbi:MAG: biotin--[acetyl-CoA-carboxylase] ligase [Clostridiales bacterium]|nr:MAG: biotin--[acetyl-CoA-carboxylase] ligase [Clostridiales bacterium]
MAWVNLEVSRLRAFLTNVSLEKWFMLFGYTIFWLYGMVDVFYYTPNGLLFPVRHHACNRKRASKAQSFVRTRLYISKGNARKKLLTKKMRKNEKNRKPSFCDKTSFFACDGRGKPRRRHERNRKHQRRRERDAEKNGCRDFATVVAERQTKGKGRSGKSFYSPDETGAYVSVALHASDDKKPYVTIIAALATARTVEEFSGSPAFIKWVNDVYLFDKKVAGILAERVISESVTGEVIGIGTNLQDPDDGFPDDIKDVAGSLNLLVDKRAEYIGALVKNLRDEYENFDKKSALKTFREKSYLTGKDVNVRDLFGTYKARVLDIDDDFGLVVMKEDGVSVLRSGVVSISVIREE